MSRCKTCNQELPEKELRHYYFAVIYKDGSGGVSRVQAFNRENAYGVATNEHHGACFIMAIGTPRSMSPSGESDWDKINENS